MRTACTLITALLVPYFAAAQIDLNKMMLQKQPGSDQKGSVQVQEDESPYVPNSFVGSYRMEMHIFKKGVEDKHSPMNIRYAFQKDMTAMNIENMDEKARTMRMLYDLPNKWQYMLMDDGKGKKSAIKQKMKKIKMDTDKKNGADEMKISMTDEYKDIDGHKCRKITGENAEGKGEWWVAQDVDIDMMQVMSIVEARGRAHDEYARFGGKGLPMEMNWEKTDGSDRITMSTKEIVIGKADPGFFDLSGYQVTDMTAMPGFGH